MIQRVSRQRTSLGGWLAAALTSAILSGASGCAGSPSQPAAATTAKATGPQGVEKTVHSIRRDVDRQTVQNDLRQIALLYQEYATDNGRPPATELEFLKYIRRDAPEQLMRIQQRLYVVVPKTRPASKNIVAYEREPDLNNKHVVARGDGTIELLRSDELEATLRQKD